MSFEKKLNCAVKSCFNRKKYDTSYDLKLMFPFEFLLKIREATYLLILLSNRAPPFINLVIPSLSTKKRTNFYFDVKYKSHYLKNRFFARAIECWNDFIISNPLCIILSFQTVKKPGPIF